MKWSSSIFHVHVQFGQPRSVTHTSRNANGLETILIKLCGVIFRFLTINWVIKTLNSFLFQIFYKYMGENMLYNCFSTQIQFYNKILFG